MGYTINFKDGTTKHFNGEIKEDFVNQINEEKSCYGIDCNDCPLRSNSDNGLKCFLLSSIELIIRDEEIEIGDEVEISIKSRLKEMGRFTRVEVVNHLFRSEDIKIKLIKKAEKSMTFQRIRDESIKWLVSENGVKRYVVGFSRERKLITDKDDVVVAWGEPLIKNWKKA